MFEGDGGAVFVVGGDDVVGEGFYPGPGVFGDDGGAGELEHAGVVGGVAHGQDVGGSDAEGGGDFGEGFAFAHARTEDLEDVGVAAGVADRAGEFGGNGGFECLDPGGVAQEHELGDGDGEEGVEGTDKVGGEVFGGFGGVFGDVGVVVGVPLVEDFDGDEDVGEGFAGEGDDAAGGGGGEGAVLE